MWGVEMELLLGMLCWGALWMALGYSVGAPKGRASAGVVLAFFLGPIGVAIAFALADVTRYDCPACAETVKLSASKCAHCGTALTPRPMPDTRAMGPLGWVLIAVMLLVVIVFCRGAG